VTDRDRQRLSDIHAAIQAIRSHLERGRLVQVTAIAGPPD
jgi:hypothetical protein